MRIRRFAAALLAALIAGCAPAAEVPTPAPIAAQAAVAATVTPAIVAVRDVVLQVAPEPHRRDVDCPDEAIALIVEFEVSSRGYYEARLRSPIWPGGASGATWGIGYDGGHQPRTAIMRAWHMHDHVEALASTAGITGQRARELIRELQFAVTEWHLAVEVFEADSLPIYYERAARAFDAGWQALPPLPRCVLTSVVYNRGTSMLGDSRREMRAIRDECVPAGDLACIAREIRAMCRLWVGTPNEAGLCRRREAEANLLKS